MQGEFYGILELMGHVRVAGRITEEERFGGKLGRIDIPDKDGGFTTQYFNAASIYRLTPTSEEAARAVALNCQPHPVHAWELPKPALTHDRDNPTHESVDVELDDPELSDFDHHEDGHDDHPRNELNF